MLSTVLVSGVLTQTTVGKWNSDEKLLRCSIPNIQWQIRVRTPGKWLDAGVGGSHRPDDRLEFSNIPSFGGFSVVLLGLSERIGLGMADYLVNMLGRRIDGVQLEVLF